MAESVSVSLAERTAKIKVQLVFSRSAANQKRSRREWSRRESSDIDEARKGERAGASESIEA
jgi:hypothetical protein